SVARPVAPLGQLTSTRRPTARTAPALRDRPGGCGKKGRCGTAIVPSCYGLKRAPSARRPSRREAVVSVSGERRPNPPRTTRTAARTPRDRGCEFNRGRGGGFPVALQEPAGIGSRSPRLPGADSGDPWLTLTTSFPF